MRIVLDTNIFISGILKANSIPAAAVHQVCASHVLLSSLATQQEIRRVLAKPYFKICVTNKILRNIDHILAHSELITITTRVAACRDPMDDKFLELAVAGKAEIVVTGDKDLLTLNSYGGIPIMTAAQFLVIS